MIYFQAAQRLWFLVATGIFAIIFKLCDGFSLSQACAFPIVGVMLAVFLEAQLKLKR